MGRWPFQIVTDNTPVSDPLAEVLKSLEPRGKREGRKEDQKTASYLVFLYRPIFLM
jgi:hypothetical protein